MSKWIDPGSPPPTYQEAPRPVGAQQEGIYSPNQAAPVHPQYPTHQHDQPPIQPHNPNPPFNPNPPHNPNPPFNPNPPHNPNLQYPSKPIQPQHPNPQYPPQPMQPQYPNPQYPPQPVQPQNPKPQVVVVQQPVHTTTTSGGEDFSLGCCAGCLCATCCCGCSVM